MAQSAENKLRAEKNGRLVLLDFGYGFFVVFEFIVIPEGLYRGSNFPLRKAWIPAQKRCGNDA
jgi:hypothetical protein